jgi:hypothetical protein
MRRNAFATHEPGATVRNPVRSKTDVMEGFMKLWKTRFDLPLDDQRHLFARVGLRFLCCTAPYLMGAFALVAFGSKSLNVVPACFMLAIPILGGVSDWYRLKHRCEASRQRIANCVASWAREASKKPGGM